MNRRGKPSVTFTAFIWFGMLLAVAGAVVAILGIGCAVVFSGKVAGAEVKTTSLGLAILAIGALLAGVVATRLPKGVVVFEVSRETVTEKIARRAIWLFLLAIAAALLFIISMAK
jgi:hypothetical protein